MGPPLASSWYFLTMDRFIVATSGAYHPSAYGGIEFGPLVRHAMELAGVHGRRPQFGFLATATGDRLSRLAERGEAARRQGWQFNPLQLFAMPNVADIREYLLAQDVIWVDGGSVANLLAVWQVHGIGEIMREAWERGVILGGVSAGSMCWHQGGATDSFGEELRPCTNGLGFLPYGNGVHYGVNPLRRTLLQELVGQGVFPSAYSSEDGIGLVYHGTELMEVISDRPEVYGWHTYCDGDDVVEERLQPRRLRV